MNTRMKHSNFAVVMIIILTVIASCSRPSAQTAEKKQEKQTTEIGVVYFHGSQRCLTCRAIEKFAKETVDSCFAGNDSVKFKIVDITTPEGEKLADKYEIASSALFIIKEANGKTSYSDMTPFAFKNARKNIPAFRKGIENKVREYLSQP